jgi:hypothetical protein
MTSALAQFPSPSAAPTKPEVQQEGALISAEKLRAIYDDMLRCRSLGRKRGGEAARAACIVDLRADDLVFCAPGDDPVRLLCGTHSTAVNPLRDEEHRVAIAGGAALVLSAQQRGNVALVFCERTSAVPDGVLQLASERRLPFICVVLEMENRRRSPERRRFESFNIPFVPVDGRDAVAVYRVVYESLHKARGGSGPTVIECSDYKVDPIRDPLKHLESYMKTRGMWR